MAENFTARKQTGWQVVSLTPDVCKTPMGSSTPPVPYPVTAELSEASDVVENVLANGYPVVVYDKSFVPMTRGDAAGSAKGVKSGTVEGKCTPDERSKTVRAGSKLIIRHDDKFWMNGK
ncbi:MAG: DUF4150 domain-containing protein [Polyangiaceae bacterium]